MKKLLLVLLSAISGSLFAQEKVDTTLMKTDSVKVDTLINSKETSTKRKKIEEDTLSYAEEFKRDRIKFTFGLRGGISFGKYQVKEIKDVVRVSSSGLPQFPIVRDNFLNNAQSTLGYLGGVFVRMTKGSFYFQPEAVYSQKGGKFDILQTNGTLFRRVSGTINAVDIPLLFGLRFRQARIFAGPVASFPMSFNQEIEDALKVYTIKDVKNELLVRPKFGINAGIGFEFKHFFVEGRYEGLFVNMLDYEIGPANNPVQFQMAPSQFQISIGLVK
ncbi:MAG: porin family protein [Emticicia sp.]|uniref:porin family protein n=1 Tax=Emticicia sp. TaxID=1930953 RepID=UPI003BA47509